MRYSIPHPAAWQADMQILFAAGTVTERFQCLTYPGILCRIRTGRMRKSFAVLICILAPTVPALEPTAQVSAEPALPEEMATTPMDEIFAQIVSDARRIEHMLSEVTDKETADRSADMLEEMLVHMDAHLRELEQYSFRHELEAEALKAHMTTLTHISQNYLSAMQRLAEVNAYGSENLLALFVRYKVDGEKRSHLQAEDMPHTQLYGELADTVEDVIYTLSRVQSAEDARAALSRLQTLLGNMNRMHHMLAQLVPPSTDEQKDAVRPARDKLRKLFKELQKATDRLQAAQSYGNKELDTLLPQILSLALG